MFYALLGDAILIFPNLGLNTACWAHCMCHHELWPTSVSPFPFLNISKTSLRENITRKLLSIPQDFFLKKIALQFCFSYIACYLIISPYTLLIGLLLKYMSLFHSRQLVKHFRNIANWCRVTISDDKSWLLSLFCCCFSSNFVKVIATCELCVIFVREGTHSGFAFTVGCPWWKRDVEIDTVRERLINVITHSLTIYSPWLLPYGYCHSCW